MKKLIILCLLAFVTELSAGPWKSRKQIASGLSKVAYEQHKQDLNAINFGKIYSDANKTRMEKAVKNEVSKEMTGNM